MAKYIYYKLPKNLLKMIEQFGLSQVVRYEGDPTEIKLMKGGIVRIPKVSLEDLLYRRREQYIPAPGMKIYKKKVVVRGKGKNGREDVRKTSSNKLRKKRGV